MNAPAAASLTAVATVPAASRNRMLVATTLMVVALAIAPFAACIRCS